MYTGVNVKNSRNVGAETQSENLRRGSDAKPEGSRGNITRLPIATLQGSKPTAINDLPSLSLIYFDNFREH